MTRPRHIVAIGGAAFTAEPENLAIERYILGLTKRRRPAVCFVPTASAEPPERIARFYDAFTRLGAVPTCLRLFERTPDVGALLLNQDVIYVGGGNTKSMLAVWREWGLPEVLRQAWRRGIVLAGVSAGAICWFQAGVTDSWAGRLAPLECLGLLPGSCCPHYDSELDRRPFLHQFIASKQLSNTLALDDGAAVHFVGRRPHRPLVWRPSAHVYRVRLVGGAIVETSLPPVRLRKYSPR
jgi:peptidase E